MTSSEHPVSPRRAERVLVLQGLFMMDVGKASLKEALGNLRQASGELEAWGYVERTLTGIERERGAIDDAIRANIQHWKWDRLARVDRNLMRLGCYEMLYTKDHPFTVFISEAVDLAKEYGDENSGGFVNGVLDAIWRHRNAPLPVPELEPVREPVQLQLGTRQGEPPPVHEPEPEPAEPAPRIRISLSSQLVAEESPEPGPAPGDGSEEQ